MSLVAEVAETDAYSRIERENGRRRIAVYGNGDARRDRTAIVGDIRRILAETNLPQGYSVAFEGTFQAQEEATLRIGGLSLVSLGIIFALVTLPIAAPPKLPIPPMITTANAMGRIWKSSPG